MGAPTVGRAQPGKIVLRTTVRSGNVKNEADGRGHGDGNSNISGADYAKAFVDEIEKPEHRRQRFSVAY